MAGRDYRINRSDSQERVADFMRSLHGNDLPAGSSVSALRTSHAEIESGALPGETPEVTEARRKTERRLIARMIWQGEDVLAVLAAEGIEPEAWIETVTRVDFMTLIEHHVAARKVLVTNGAISVAGASLGSENEKMRLQAAKMLIDSAGDHELFRSKITAAMTTHSKHEANPTSLGSAEIMSEVLAEAARIYQESVKALEVARDHPERIWQPKPGAEVSLALPTAQTSTIPSSSLDEDNPFEPIPGDDDPDA